MEDEKGSIWKSDNEGVGSYMNILFKKVVKPHAIIVAQPQNMNEMNKTLKIH